jgi:hypothetical protein
MIAWASACAFQYAARTTSDYHNAVLCTLLFCSLALPTAAVASLDARAGRHQPMAGVAGDVRQHRSAAVAGLVVRGFGCVAGAARPRHTNDGGALAGAVGAALDLADPGSWELSPDHGHCRRRTCAGIRLGQGRPAGLRRPPRSSPGPHRLPPACWRGSWRWRW